MKINNNFPSREEAATLFLWAYEKNPEPWAEHCKAVARAAETIALKCGLNPEKAYILGLFHDIGYYGYKNGKGKTCHIYIGYKLLKEKGYEDMARICLTHSFPLKDIRAYGGSDMNCTDEERAVITTFLSETEYDDYDRIIQLCDCIGTAQGIVLLEQRCMGVVMRAGFNDFTLKKWESYFSLKAHFDKKCEINIYNLFYDEIKNNIFGS